MQQVNNPDRATEGMGLPSATGDSTMTFELECDTEMLLLEEGPLAVAVGEAHNPPSGPATANARKPCRRCGSIEHLERLRALFQSESCSDLKPRRRGPVGQRCRRELEEEVRYQAVDFCHWTQARGGTIAQAAELLNLEPRTLRQWSYDCQPDQIQVVPLGRPAARSDRHQRNAVLGFLNNQGPSVSLHTLQQYFPGMARAELDHLRRRYRRVLHDRYHDTLHVLHWQTPGRVWALDFAEPSELGSATLPPVDGLFSFLLAVRDLASGYVLAWLPLPDTTAEVLLPILRQLFDRHGAPLVLKSDNGSAFCADQTIRLLEEVNVFPLFSPPHWPRYNGAIEAGIGSLKIRTDQHAARQGRTAWWTSDDLAAAVHEANTLAHYHGRIPADIWAARRAISPSERARFHLAVDRERFTERVEQRIALDEPLDHWDHSAIDRQAIPRALVEHGYLLFRRGRIPLRVRRRKVTGIS